MPFQDFEPRSRRSFAAEHVPLLRAELQRLGVDGFIIPHDDEYLNEYTPECAERLMWISGFTGSAGAAIVTASRAALFIDGRYTLQARDQVDGAVFEFVDLVETPPHKWLRENVGAGERIGYDPRLHSKNAADRLRKTLEAVGAALVSLEANPVDAAWTDRPDPPSSRCYPHPMQFAGKSSEDKRKDIAAILEKDRLDAVMLTDPASVAWLLNIRGGDVARTPLPLCRAILHADGGAELFIAPTKVANELPAHLGDAVSIRDEATIGDAVSKLKGKRVSLDPARAPMAFFSMLTEAGAEIIAAGDPCALPRACKNESELAGARRAHIRDGAAVTRFLHWIATEGQTGAVDEITAAMQLEAFRTEQGEVIDLSFDTISSVGPNAAINHYRVTTETNRKLAPDTLYLVDSGAQYYDGTTDITRTVAIGRPSAEMRDRFTRVLKGHIALAQARFPKGISGVHLDAFARRPLWEAGLDFDHGTGHGVGSFLAVHEGPQKIAKALIDAPLAPGMICSNEPGFYKAGHWGIRIENLVIVTPPATIEDGDREMMGFETITLAPIERDLIDIRLLTDAERGWLNRYHARVREMLGPLLPSDVAAWLSEKTEPL